MMVNRALISIVDDNESARISVEGLLRSVGYKVAAFQSCELFLKSEVIVDTKCLILDIRMRGMDGLELQRRLNFLRAGVPIIFVTAYEDPRQRQQAMDAGASGFFKKPYPAADFLVAIQTALKNA